jgi:hypothetical protein
VNELVRLTRPIYYLTIEAKDGGHPPRSVLYRRCVWNTITIVLFTFRSSQVRIIVNVQSTIDANQILTTPSIIERTTLTNQQQSSKTNTPVAHIEQIFPEQTVVNKVCLYSIK